MSHHPWTCFRFVVWIFVAQLIGGAFRMVVAEDRPVYAPLYGLSSSIELINRLTGKPQSIFKASAPYRMHKTLAIAPTGRLFSIVLTDPSFGPVRGQLVAIDRMTGEESLLSPQPKSALEEVEGLEADYSGVLYGLTLRRHLLKIDPALGEVTDLGLLNIDVQYHPDAAYGVSDVAIQPTSGALFAVVQRPASSEPAQLVRIDPRIPSVAVIGALPTELFNLGQGLVALDFDPSGRLVTVNCVGKASWMAIDTETAAVTPLNDFADQSRCPNFWALASKSLAIPNPDPFRFTLGNLWTYQLNRQATFSVAVTGTSEGSMPDGSRWMVEARKKGRQVQTDFFETGGGELRLVGGTLSLKGRHYSITLEDGVPFAWYPIEVGDRRTSTVAGKLAGTDMTLQSTSSVLGKEILQLPLEDGAVKAFKIRNQIQVLVPDKRPLKRTFYQWFVPYLGVVRTNYYGPSWLTLSLFSLENGNFTPESNSDMDSWLDFREATKSATNWLMEDSDADNFYDDEDNCPTAANPDQMDSNNDGTGDACELAVSGTISRGTLLDKPEAGRDQFEVTLKNCWGLLDALFDCPGKSVQWTIGSTASPRLAGDRIRPSAQRTIWTLKNKDRAAQQVTFNSRKETIKLNGSGIDLGELINPISVSVEIGGWTCISAQDWNVKHIADGTRYRIRRAPTEPQ